MMPTTSPTSSSGPYHAHRERQRRRILGAAEELFDIRGIDRVPIADIVAAAGIRASTFYEYFSNKDEIVWALVEEAMLQSSARVLGATKTATGPALARITALLEAFGDELVDHPQGVRLLAQFDAMYARDWSAERLLALEDRLFPGRFKFNPRRYRRWLAPLGSGSGSHFALRLKRCRWSSAPPSFPGKSGGAGVRPAYRSPLSRNRAHPAAWPARPLSFPAAGRCCPFI